MRVASPLFAVFSFYLLIPNSFAFVCPTSNRYSQLYRRVSTPIQASSEWSLQAVKLVYKWRVLPSGCLTGITDEGIITTSELKRPDTAAPNAIVLTTTGSQYKLVGKPVDNKSSFVSSPGNENATTTTVKNGTSAAASLALFAGFGIFILVLIQKSGILSSPAITESGNFEIVRFIALLVYCVGVLVATVQLIDDAIKFKD